MAAWIPLGSRLGLPGSGAVGVRELLRGFLSAYASGFPNGNGMQSPDHKLIRQGSPKRELREYGFHATGNAESSRLTPRASRTATACRARTTS